MLFSQEIGNRSWCEWRNCGERYWKHWFIMALCVGISSVLGDRRNKENSFGMVALWSVGPSLSVLVLGMFSTNKMQYTVPDYGVSNDIAGAFLHTALHTCKEVGLALGLIVVFFVICQFAFLKLPIRNWWSCWVWNPKRRWSSAWSGRIWWKMWCGHWRINSKPSVTARELPLLCRWAVSLGLICISF